MFGSYIRQHSLFLVVEFIMSCLFHAHGQGMKFKSCYLLFDTRHTHSSHQFWFFFFALDDQSVDAAELFERASQSIKVKSYTDALDDLNAAIEADPSLSEAYFKRASILRRFCRYAKLQKRSSLSRLHFNVES